MGFRGLPTPFRSPSGVVTCVTAELRGCVPAVRPRRRSWRTGVSSASRPAPVTQVRRVPERGTDRLAAGGTAGCLAVAWPYSPQLGTGSTEEERTTFGGAVPTATGRPARPPARPV